MNPTLPIRSNKPLLRGLSLAAAVAAVLAGSHSASAQSSGAFTFSGTVSGPGVNADALVGLTATKTYLGAYNLGQGAVARTVNGVVFAGVAGINPTAAGVFSTTGLGVQHAGAGAVPGGQLGLVATDFVYGGGVVPEVFTYSNLTIGQTYVVSYYSKVWDPAARVQNLSAGGASTGTVASYDQNTGGVTGSLNVLRYTFQAASATQTISFVAAVSGTTNHQYGFTLEQTFNNSWTGGANWTTSTWSGGAAVAPNSAGANANFTAQGAPTTIDLDANRTVGHIQFAGTNAWTIGSTGGNTLTLQSDVGGAATLSALAGTHTIAPNITLSSPTLMKLGAGTVVLNGNITGGTSTVQVGGGNLTLGGTNTYTGVNVIGNGTLEVKSVSDYGVASAFGSRTLAQENATITGVGLHFQGGTLKFTGSTAQSTNRNIRILNGATGATIDASGTVPGATLSFTKTGANMNLFDTGGTRTLNLTGSNTGDNGFAIQLTNQAASATSLTKAGAGTWVLNGVDANTATGNTTVNGGVLKLAKTGVLAVSGGLNIGNGTASAVVQLGGTGGNQIVDPSISVFSGSGANAGILRMNNLNETIGGLSSAAGAGIVENESGAAGTGTLSVNMTTTQTFGGILRNGDGAGTDGALAFTKLGAGTQILTGASTHTGATTVSAGTLTVDGSLGAGSAVSVTGATLNGAGTVAGSVAVNAAGVVNGTGTFSGPVTVNAGGLVGGTGTFNLAGATSILSGGTVGGTGAFSGTVTANSGGRVSPATSTTAGTLAINALTLGSGSLLDLEFGGTSDLVNVTGAGGLTLNGGAFNLFAAGGVTPLTANGTYTVLDYNTSYGGLLANLGVANAQVGKFYSIADDTVNTVLNLSITDAVITEWNGGAADNVWTTDGNWTALAPNSAGTVANFGLIPGAPTNVAVSGAKTVGGIIFNNASSYTVSGGAGDTITMSNGIATAGISVTSGSHTLAAPVVLAGSATATTAALTTLTVSGNISGANAFNAAGSGTTILTGTNSYGVTNVTGGTLQIGAGGTTGTIGTGDATLAAGASLAFNRSDDLTIASNLGGLGTVTKNLANTLTLTGVNSFGALNIVGGTVKPGNATGIPAGATVAVGAGATFDMNEFNTTVAGLSGAGTVTENGFTPGTTTLTVSGAGSSTFSGIIADGFDRAVAFVKAGTGTQTFDGSASNSYYGGTTITGGTLILARNAGFNGIVGSITIGDANGTDVLQLNGSDQIGDDTVITFNAGGSGNSAIFHLNGNNETVRGITTTLANAAVLANMHATLPSVLTLDTAGASYTYDGVIRNGAGGTFGLTKTGAGTLTIANTAVVAATNYTGTTTLNAGQIILDNLNGFASPIVNNVVAANSLVFNQSSRDLTTAGIISGPGGLTKNGPNSLTLSGVNSFTGPFTLNNGILGIGQNGALGAGEIVINGGNLRAAGAPRAMSNPVTVNASFILGRVTDLNGAITLNADVTITGSNPDGVANGNSLLGPVGGNFRLTLAEGAGGVVAPFGLGTGALVVNAANTNTAGTTVASGRVNVSGTGALANAPLTVSNGILNLSNVAQSVTSFDGGAGATVNLAAGHTLTVTQAGDTTFAGILAGAGGLTKADAGKLTLSGASPALTGPTSVNGGTLVVSGSISGSAVTLNGGTLAGTGSTGAVTSIGGTVAPGASPGTLTTGAMTLDGASLWKFELATAGVVGSGVNDLLTIGGALALDGTLQITTLGGFNNGTYRLANYSGGLTDNGLALETVFTDAYPGSTIDTTTLGQVNLVVVPEPGSALLLLGGLGAVAGLRRRRPVQR